MITLSFIGCFGGFSDCQHLRTSRKVTILQAVCCNHYTQGGKTMPLITEYHVYLKEDDEVLAYIDPFGNTHCLAIKVMSGEKLYYIELVNFKAKDAQAIMQTILKGFPRLKKKIAEEGASND